MSPVKPTSTTSHVGVPLLFEEPLDAELPLLPDV